MSTPMTRSTAVSGKPKSRKQGKAPGRMAARKHKQADGALSFGSAPVAVGTRIQTRAPQIQSRNNSTRVRMSSELVLAQVNSSVAFTVQQVIPLNPGFPNSFPWLSKTAVNWEQYRVHSLEFFWVPIAPTTAQGQVILSPSYDASDSPPTTLTMAANNWGSVSFSVWEEQRLRLDIQSMMALGPRRFVRSQAMAGDIKTFDVGFLSVCTNNCAADGNPLGSLYVSYDIEFFIPNSDPVARNVALQTSLLLRTSAQLINGTYSAINFAVSSSHNALAVVESSTANYTLPAGTYIAWISLSFNDTTAQSDFPSAYSSYGGISSLTYSTSPIPSGAGFDQAGILSWAWLFVCTGSGTFQVWAICGAASNAATTIQGTVLFQLA